MLRVLTWSMAALLAAAAFAARAPSPEACQTGRLLGVRAPLFAVATALEDTVLAGPGPIRYPAGDTTALQSIHGQRFRLDALGGDVPAWLDGEVTEAVLVPYGWECRETWRWRESRWAQPGLQVFVDLNLRPREMWAGGLPTFDVEVVHDVYPESYTRYVDTADNLLTPTQVFALTRVLPTYDQVEAAPDSAYGPLLAWARANPGLAARFPASHALAEANDWLQPCHPAYNPHPVAGTYRATLVVEGRDTLTTYLQTSASGYPMCPPPLPPLREAVLRPRLADTARLYVFGAPDTATILVINNAHFRGGGRCGAGTFDVANRPVPGGPPSWDAQFNDAMLPSCFPDRPEVRRATEAIYAAYVAGARANGPGRFRETAEGGMTFEQTWRANGRVVLRMNATRVSARTLPEWDG